MCGRYLLTAKERYIRDHFGLEEEGVAGSPSSESAEWTTRWNIPPTQQAPTIRQHPREPRRTWAMAPWGLIPYWAKDVSIGVRTINAAAETAAEKPAFRDAMQRRRCPVSARVNRVENDDPECAREVPPDSAISPTLF